MDWSLILQQITVAFVPLIVVFFFVYRMMKSFFEQFENQRKHDLRIRFSQEILPIKLQAYERIALLLERITPESMIMRVNQSGMTVLDLQKALLASIREEFEHNMSQQIYVSGQAWAMVTAARQSMVQLISETAAELKPSDSANELATDLLTEFASISDDPLTLAKSFIREEVKSVL